MRYNSSLSKEGSATAQLPERTYPLPRTTFIALGRYSYHLRAAGRFVLAWLCLVSVAACAQVVVPPPVDAGELRLDGVLTRVDAGAGLLQMTADSLLLSDGQRTALRPPKPKPVRVNAATVLVGREPGAAPLTLAALQVGQTLCAVGVNNSSGTALTARVVVVGPPGAPPLPPAPELVLQTGHALSEIEPCALGALAWSPDGQIIATGGVDGRVILWDVATSSAQRVFIGHIDRVVALAFSPDGRTLASASWDRTVRLWDVAGQQARHRVLSGHTGFVAAVAFAPDGRRVASASWDNTVRLWDVATGRPAGAPLTSHGAAVTCVAYSPDGRMLVSGGSDKAIRCWEAGSGKLRRQITKAHAGEVKHVSFVADGHTLISSGGRTVRLWNVDSGRPLGEPWSADNGWGVVCATRGTLVACITGGFGKGSIRLIDCAGGRLKPGRLLDGVDGAAGHLAFSSDGRTLAINSTEQRVTLYDLASGETTGIFQYSHRSKVKAVVFRRDGTLAVASGEWTLTHWDLAAVQMRRQPLALTTMPSGHMVFSADGGILLCGSWQYLYQWDTTTGQRRGQFGYHDNFAVWGLALSPDGRTLAAGYGDFAVVLYDALTGRPKGRPMRGHREKVPGVQFSPDGRTVASGDWLGQVRLWDVSGTRPKGPPLNGHTDWVVSLAFSPDCRTLASASWDRTVRLWDTASGKCRQVLRGHKDKALCVAYSPDGRTLATGSSDSTVRLWDAATGQPRGVPLTGHGGAVLSLAFSADGRRLATAGGGAVRLWDVATGARLATLYVLDAGQNWLALTPEGYYAGSPDACKLVRWRRDGVLLPATESAAAQRPDFVRRSLAGIN